ncbi:MAG: cell division protein FtsB [Gammaproteobacteria bacterium]|jgi:cell division protein FtsB|nr:cell division protein FtsB [Gammaproteobacteria bacterium]
MTGTSTAWRLLLLGLAVMLLYLQARLWLSDEGWSDVLRLRSSVAEQQQENARLAERNRQLRAEVGDLKGGFSAIEERARADLGMIAEQESFYLLVPDEAGQDEQAD